MQSDVAFHVKLSPVIAGGAHFAQHVVAQGVGIFAQQLCADGEIIEDGSFLVQVYIRKREARKFMLGKKSHTGLHPFLEALVHLERQGVLYGEIVCAVGGCVTVGEEVGKKVVQLLARGEITVVAFGTQRVNERSHGHKAPHEGGILRQCL